MQMTSIANAIDSLRPNAVFVLRGNTYAGLDWLDQVQTKPTEQEINAEVARLDALAATESQRIASVRQDTEFVDVLNKLTSMTPAQWKAITDNISDLNQARTMFYRMGLVLMLLAQRITK